MSPTTVMAAPAIRPSAVPGATQETNSRHFLDDSSSRYQLIVNLA